MTATGFRPGAGMSPFVLFHCVNTLRKVRNYVERMKEESSGKRVRESEREREREREGEGGRQTDRQTDI